MSYLEYAANFNGGLRAWYHCGRFHWIRNQFLKRYPQPQRILELGCFDAKTLQFLPWTPSRYYGFDAGWHGGLDQAKHTYASSEHVRLFECRTPDDLKPPEQVEIGICMEVLEHLPESILDGYLQKLSALVKNELYVTAPVEFGLPFLMKRSFRPLVGGRSRHHYTAAELFSASVGRTGRVRRDEHKGFDYRRLRERLQTHFEHVETESAIFGVPVGLSPTVGIIASHRKCPES